MKFVAALLVATLAAFAATGNDCPAYKPVATVSTVDVYTGPHNSLIDPRKAAENRRLLAPVTGFMMYLETSLDRQGIGPGELSCQTSLLRDWASSGALLKSAGDEPSRSARAFMTTGFAMIILKFNLRGVPIAPEVAHWLAQLSNAARQDFSGSRSNVYPYTGVTAAISALVSHDADSLRYQDQVWANYTAEIKAGGTLPAELARGSRALVFHQMAANGLLMLHQIRRYGLGRSDDPKQVAKLKLLLNMIGKNLCHPTNLGGAKQELPGIWGFRLAFPFDEDDLIPESWTTCGPSRLDFFDVTGGGDTRVSAEAVKAMRRQRTER